MAAAVDSGRRRQRGGLGRACAVSRVALRTPRHLMGLPRTRGLDGGRRWQWRCLLVPVGLALAPGSPHCNTCGLLRHRKALIACLADLRKNTWRGASSSQMAALHVLAVSCCRDTLITPAGVSPRPRGTDSEQPRARLTPERSCGPAGRCCQPCEAWVSRQDPHTHARGRWGWTAAPPTSGADLGRRHSLLTNACPCRRPRCHSTAATMLTPEQIQQFEQDGGWQRHAAAAGKCCLRSLARTMAAAHPLPACPHPCRLPGPRGLCFPRGGPGAEGPRRGAGARVPALRGRSIRCRAAGCGRQAAELLASPSTGCLPHVQVEGFEPDSISVFSTRGNHQAKKTDRCAEEGGKLELERVGCCAAQPCGAQPLLPHPACPRSSFLDSASAVSFFFEEGALDGEGRLVAPKNRAINKIGHGAGGGAGGCACCCMPASNSLTPPELPDWHSHTRPPCPLPTAMHDLDPVFRRWSRSDKVAQLMAALGFLRPLPVQVRAWHCMQRGALAPTRPRPSTSLLDPTPHS